MIFYFSGTGNSGYVAKELGRHLDEKVVKITDLSPECACFEGSSLGFVFPVYSWGVPPLMNSYVLSLSETFIEAAGKYPVWMVCVCGDETALAPEMLKNVLGRRGLKLSGGWSVIMPNNYVILPGFNVDSKDVEKDKLEKAPDTVSRIAQRISSGNWEENYTRGSMQRIKSKMIYPLFKKWGIFPSKWHSTGSCIGCGKCEKACPVGNVKMSGNKPVWSSDCVSCLACYHICPKHAVQYGKATQHKGQYFFKQTHS